MGAVLRVEDEDVALSPSPTTASSGSDSAVRGALSIATLSSMPGCSRRSRIGQPGAHRHRAGVGIDHRVDRRDDAAERLVGIGFGARLDRLALAERRQHRLRHGEIELDRRDVADRGDRRALADDRADRDVAQGDPAGEGRADHPVADRRLRRWRLGAGGGGGGDARVIIGAGGEAAILQRLDARELLLAPRARGPAPRASAASCWPCARTAMIWPRWTKLPSSKFSRAIRSVTGAEIVTCSLATRCRPRRSGRRSASASAALGLDGGRRALALLLRSPRRRRPSASAASGDRKMRAKHPSRVAQCPYSSTVERAFVSGGRNPRSSAPRSGIRHCPPAR